jgi:hypothetical protein
MMLPDAPDPYKILEKYRSILSDFAHRHLCPAYGYVRFPHQTSMDIVRSVGFPW